MSLPKTTKNNAVYLAAKREEPVMMRDQQIEQLERRVETLIALSAQLRDENLSLLQRETLLINERAELIKKNDQARAKVEAIISRLRSLEQES